MNQFDIKEVEECWRELVNEFPEIFLEPSPEVKGWYDKYAGKGVPKDKGDLVCLRFSFECGSGWIEVIRELCLNIRAFVNKERAAGHEAWAKSCIVKEKFGELAWQGDQHFSRDGALKEFWGIISAAEQKSLTVCELTGEAGALCKKGGWLKTLSEEKAKEMGYIKI